MSNLNNVKFTTIIPSAGGLLLPMIEEFKNFPSEIFSFEEVSERDKNCLEYLKNKNIKYTLLKDSDEISEKFDLIGILAPCAGLSDLVKSNERNEANNNWIIKTLKLALKTKSKIVFGENSANLLSDMGKETFNEMIKIAKENNYKILFYLTKAQNYGNPQKRERCFYICFNKESFSNFPIMAEGLYIKEGLINYVTDSDMADLNTDKPSDNIYYKFLYKKLSSLYPTEVIDHASFISKMVDLKGDKKYIRLQREALKYVDELIDFLKNKNDTKNLEKIEAIKKKIKNGKNFWGDKITISHYNVPVMVANSCINLVHPFKDRFINKREAIRLMDFPDDYNYVTDKKYFFKNVPLKMSKSIIANIHNFLNNEYASANKEGDYIIQTYGSSELVSGVFSPDSPVSSDSADSSGGSESI